MANYFLPLSYGSAPIYFVTVAGCPVIFTERATGLTLPAGWTSEDSSLVIDDSAEVGVGAIDRDKGIGTGLDFSFKFLDTPTVRDWMRRWQMQATLTATLPYGSTGAYTAYVDSTAGWPSSGYFYCGNERIHYSGISGNSFTGLGRAQAGTVAVDHPIGTTGQIVTDRPRYWKGREVILWCIMADASGHVCGTDLIGQEAKQIWRGRISAGPDRHIDGFQITAQSIDRLLDVPLAGKVSGDVTGVNELIDFGDTAWELTVTVEAQDASGGLGSVFLHTVTIHPYTSLTAGTLIAPQTLRDMMSAAWYAKVTAMGLTADLGHLVHADWGAGVFDAAVVIPAKASIYKLKWAVWEDGGLFGADEAVWSTGMPTSQDFQASLHADFAVDDTPGASPPKAMTVNVTSGNTADVPATGIVTVKAGDLSCVYTYGIQQVVNGQLYLGGLIPKDAQNALTVDQLSGGSTADVMQVIEGDWGDLAYQTLCSSQTGALKGQGYGLPLDSVTGLDLLSGGVLSQVVGQVPSMGKSFTDAFGGIMGLLRLAIVARPAVGEANTPILLTCVNTGPSADFKTTITDADLLCNEGDPVVSIKKADSPNAVTVECPTLVDGQGTTKYVFNDMPSVDSEGKREMTYSIGVKDPTQIQVIAGDAATSHFVFDPTLQAVELRVHPSVDVEVGDAVWLTTTHPALWTWSTNPGQVGYDGAGRCTGKRMNLKSCAVTMLLLVDGAVRVHALSPAALVTGYDHGVNPTYCDVPMLYLDHFTNALAKATAASETLQAIHYQPGQTESASLLTITGLSVASLLGGGTACRLAITYTGTMSTGSHSTITLPVTAGTTAYQRNFAHAGDLSTWS